MLARLRGAHADGDRRTVAMILKEARVLLDAEQKSLTTAAAAIRHELETKYGDHS